MLTPSMGDGGRLGGVHVWNAVDGGNVITLRALAPMAWSPDGKYLACADGDLNVGIWNAAAGFVTFIYRGLSDPEKSYASFTVDSMAWSPDGTRIASSYSGIVHVWNATDGGNVVIYRGHADTVNAVAWSPDGTYISSASRDATVRVWNAADGGNVVILSQSFPDDWSSEGTQIVSGDVQTWNAANRSVVTLSRSVPVAWSPDGTQIASLFGWGIQMWNAMNGNNVVNQHPPDFAFAVVWAPDGIRIATANGPSPGGTVQVRHYLPRKPPDHGFGPG